MSYSYNGAAAFIFDHSAAINASADELTFALWMYVPTTWGGGEYVAALGDAVNTSGDYYNQHLMLLSSTAGRVLMRSHEAPSTQTVACQADNNAGTTNVWFPVVVTVSSGSLRQIWAGTDFDTNGSSTEAIGSIASGIRYLYVGCAQGNSGSFTGYIAEVAVWNKILTQAEREKYLSGISADQIAPSNLRGYFFKKGQQNSNDNKGIFTLSSTVGTPTYQSSHPPISYNNFSESRFLSVYRFESGALTTDAKGNNSLTVGVTPTATATAKEGPYAADFEFANSEYLYLADASLSSGFPYKSGSSASSFSVCFWMRAESFTETYMAVVSKWDSAANKRQWSIWNRYNSVTGISFVISGDGTASEVLTHASSLSTATWYHVGVTYNSSTKAYRIRVWDDNAQAILGTDLTGTATNTPFISDSQFVIGARHGPSLYFDGIIDEAVIVTEVLTADEIDAIRAGTYVPASPPITNGPRIIWNYSPLRLM